MSPTNQNTTYALARAFSCCLRAFMGDTDLAQADEDNATEVNPNICHSHDHCDANEIMNQAFRIVLGRNADTQIKSDVAMWTAAWDHAKREGFMAVAHWCLEEDA